MGRVLIHVIHTKISLSPGFGFSWSLLCTLFPGRIKIFTLLSWWFRRVMYTNNVYFHIFFILLQPFCNFEFLPSFSMFSIIVMFFFAKHEINLGSNELPMVPIVVKLKQASYGRSRPQWGNRRHKKWPISWLSETLLRGRVYGKRLYDASRFGSLL